MINDSQPLHLALLTENQPVPHWLQIVGITTRCTWQGQGGADVVLRWEASQADAFADLLKPGNAIWIKAGHGATEPAELFSGKVVSTRLNINASGESTLVASCTSERPAVDWTPIPAPVVTARLGENLLACEASLQEENAVTGQVQISGTAQVAPGQRMALSGLGAAYDGEVWMTETHHEIREGLWRSAIRFAARPPQPPVPTLAQMLPLEAAYDAASNRVTLTLRNNLNVQFQARDASLRCADIHGNAITLDARGIAIASAAGLDLHGKGDVTLNTLGQAVFTLGRDYRVTATNIQHNAQVGLVARGAASAEFSAGGLAVIKAAMVTIN